MVKTSSGTSRELGHAMRRRRGETMRKRQSVLVGGGNKGQIWERANNHTVGPKTNPTPTSPMVVARTGAFLAMRVKKREKKERTERKGRGRNH